MLLTFALLFVLFALGFPGSSFLFLFLFLLIAICSLGSLSFLSVGGFGTDLREMELAFEFYHLVLAPPPLHSILDALPVMVPHVD